MRTKKVGEKRRARCAEKDQFRIVVGDEGGVAYHEERLREKKKVNAVRGVIVSATEYSRKKDNLLPLRGEY